MINDHGSFILRKRADRNPNEKILKFKNTPRILRYNSFNEKILLAFGSGYIAGHGGVAGAGHAPHQLLAHGF
jgi:hypothetical protein